MEGEKRSIKESQMGGVRSRGEGGSGASLNESTLAHFCVLMMKMRSPGSPSVCGSPANSEACTHGPCKTPKWHGEGGRGELLYAD